MIQKPRTVRRWVGAMATVLAFVAADVVAQDDQPDPAPTEAPAPPPSEPAPPKAPTPAPEDRLRFSIDFGRWIAQPTGLEFEPASVIDPLDPSGTSIEDLDFGTESDARYGFGVDLGHGNGGFEMMWWSSESLQEASASRPANFLYGELLAFPDLAGYGNDGLADGYASTAETQIREWRIDYYRPAFESSRVSGRWFVGYRDVTHGRTIEAEYFAFEPLLPPLFPPFIPMARPDLNPLPDTALVSSEFKGRGLEGGLYVTVPLIANKRLSVEGGFALAALRGDMETDYRSSNAYYVQTDRLGNRTILNPPYTQFDDVLPGPPVVYVVDSIQQEVLSIGVATEGRSTSASVVEVELGMRWRYWKTFELFGGFRSSRYDDVGVDLRPAGPTGANRQALVEEPRSVTYEGFFVGMTLGF